MTVFRPLALAALLAVALGVAGCASSDADTTQQRDSARTYPPAGPTVSVGGGPSLESGKYRYGY